MNTVDARCRVCGKNIRWLSGTPMLCAECSQKKACVAFLLTLLVLSLASFASLLTSCTGPVAVRTLPPDSATPQVMPLVTPPHQVYKTVQICLDITYAYPVGYRTQAMHQFADMIDRYPTPNIDGASIYVSWISNNSFFPEDTAMDMTIPKIPSDPAPPAAIQAPAKTGDPFTDGENAKKNRQQNALLQAHYQQALLQNHTYLAQVRALVHAQTNRLRNLVAPVPGPGKDIYGCLQRASMRFRGVGGEKYLILVTDLQNSRFDQWAGTLSLPGVHIKVLFFFCYTAPACSATQARWSAIFQQAGAQDVVYADPGVTETLQTLF